MYIEKLVEIAVRIKGDKWKLSNKDWWIDCESLTDTLEEYFQRTGYKGDFRLSPSTSRLYIIVESEKEVKVAEPVVKKFNIYGDE